MTRVKISVTVDPTLLQMVDDFVAQHQGADRSKLIDQALRLWRAAQQELAMEAQYAADDVPSAERNAWRSIQRAAASRLVGPA